MAVAMLAPTSASAHWRHHRHFAGRVVGTPTDPQKDAALIVDGETGKVLYARNADAERHPASLTKMMTLYLLFDAMHKGQVTLSTPLTVSWHASVQRPTKMYLKPGDTITVDQAIKAIVVRSANDVAVTIAEALGGSEQNFAAMMTAKARTLGMRDTTYVNASGLPDNRQISTAADLALLARHLGYDYPQYFHYFSTPAFAFRGVVYKTHDNLIGRYNGADGIKTGYTGASGFNLVSSVVRDGAHVIGVVMGGITARRRDGEMMRLLDTTFAQIQTNPKLVARADIPWQRVADASPSTAVVAGFEIPSVTPRPQPGQVTVTPNARPDPEDEDAAESALGEGDIADSPPPQTVAPQRAAPPQAAKPAAAKPPVVVAVAHPAPIQPTPRPAVVLPSPRPQMRLASLGDGEARSQPTHSNAAVPPVSDLGKAWTIQIGAFANTTTARSQLASYAEKSMDVLGQSQRIIVPFKGMDGHLLYRARFGPFVEREAREVCSRLTQRGQTCFAALASR
ncbi:MAG TPA: serine hydrolase [Rhizomicrobium sp.]|nr:serine hydrolase [Rhizomicrobium sp.]